MTIGAVARIIQIVIVPVVMITICAILVGARMAHYAAVNDRTRAVAHARLDGLRAGRRVNAG